MRFIDSLYGEIDVDISPQLLRLPEVQRLREVRLCNVNSPYIPGGANLNRFEHAIGTYYLAQKYCEKFRIMGQERRVFLASALIHDIITPPFGHSLEYVFSSYGKTAYEHANLQTFLNAKSVQEDRKFFMGMKSPVKRGEAPFDNAEVLSFLSGGHEFSRVLSGDIDLDNVDNVFRFAFHIGIDFNRRVPLKVAMALRYSDGHLIASEKDFPLFCEWFRVRRVLYRYLLENEGEFVAKALLERIFIDLIEADVLDIQDWVRTDAEFVQFVRDDIDVPNEAKALMARYMTMDFPQNSRIAYTNDMNNMKLFELSKVEFINRAYVDHGVFFHVIKDVNKTCRPIRVKSAETGLLHVLGGADDRYLLGAFSDAATAKAAGAFDAVFGALKDEFGVVVGVINKDEVRKNDQFSLF